MTDNDRLRAANCCHDVKYGRWGFVLGNPLRRMLVRPRAFVSRFASEGYSVADIGCGTGLFSFALAQAVGSKGKVHSIDHDERSIGAVRRRAARHGTANIVATIASAAALDSIPDASIDFVLSNLVICCMADHDGAVAEIQRVLKPTGSAYVSVARFGRRRHPTHVHRHEWASILDRFRVLRKGTKVMNRWALVSVS